MSDTREGIQYHHTGDKLGPRDVFVDGVKVEYCIWADLTGDKVCKALYPFQYDEETGDVITEIIKGKVEVKFIG